MRNHLREGVSSIIDNHHITRYVEPFCGGLGAFFSVYDILVKNGIKDIVLNDINHHLLTFYKAVNECPMTLIKDYMTLEHAFESTIPIGIHSIDRKNDAETYKLEMRNAETFYKKIREQFNSNQFDGAMHGAHLLFLQKHCFNGIYRENSKGHHNVPFNWEYKSFKEDDIKQSIMNASQAFSHFSIQFTNCSFKDMEFQNTDLIYADPPYLNEKDLNENKYSKGGFTLEDQVTLIEKLASHCFLYSNHDNPLLIDALNVANTDDGVEILRLSRKNIISSSSESRKNDKIEILVFKK